MILVKYKEQDTIEGYVKSEKEFTQWLKNHNIERIRQNEISEYKDEFELIKVNRLEANKSYIYVLFDGDEQIDQTSLDEMNENLAWQIMVTDEGRNPKGLSVSLIDEVQEDDSRE